MKKIINTDQAPEAIGAYSQAVCVGDSIYISGQIPLDPMTMQVVEGGFIEQAKQVFRNLSAIAKAGDSSLKDAVKMTVYVTDLANFTDLNDVMCEFVDEPHPARAAVEVSALPRDVLIEVDAVLHTG